MKLAVFGSTGGTGQHLVRLALEAGHEVVAFARSPSKLEIQDERLSIVQGNVTEPGPVSEAICGVDAVLSALGPPRGVPAGVMGEGLDNILAAMREHGVRRLLIVVGAGVGDPQDRPKLFDRLIELNSNARRQFLGNHKAYLKDIEQKMEVSRQLDELWESGFEKLKVETLYDGAHISPWETASHETHEPRRPRKLLLHRYQINRLADKVQAKGYTLVPLRLYLKDNRAKVEIALARGKRQYDKRQAIAKPGDRDKKCLPVREVAFAAVHHGNPAI